MSADWEGGRCRSCLRTAGPGRVFEFLDAIGPLTDPVRFDAPAEGAFDVVVPSLPSFGFSSKPKGKPVGPATTARVWHKLMRDVLGYTGYGAQDGDCSQAVAIQLASQFADELAGIHLNRAVARPIPEAEQTDEQRAWIRAAAAHSQSEPDYFREQMRKPQTVAFAPSDNPLGAAAWIAEKFKAWRDSGNNIEQAFTKDQLLTNLMLYLVTNTAGSAVWFYRGAADEGQAARRKITVPTGFAAFPKENPGLQPPRSVLERDFNLTHYTKCRAAVTSHVWSNRNCWWATSAISSANCATERRFSGRGFAKFARKVNGRR
jgi:pimeloyl-ACP methyl ester carboxylesterase